MIPDRLRRAVALLALFPADRELEIGCGGGIAVRQVCDQLRTGSSTALDHSAIAIDRAKKRRRFSSSSKN
jgi:ubiquinone/menaquinone biosynthesis C-methylase UbiE